MLLRLSFVFAIFFIAPTVVDAIVGGTPSRRGQFPFFVFLEFSNGTVSKKCGGALIETAMDSNVSWVLTAAHCFNSNPTHVKLHFGVGDFYNSSEYGRTKRIVSLEHFFVHPSYHISLNDIGLIRLPIPVELNAYVQPIRMAKFFNKLGKIKHFDGIVVGRGAQEFRGVSSNTTQYAPMKSINVSDCVRAYPPLAIKSTAFCASGKNGESTCHGNKIYAIYINDQFQNLKCMSYFAGDSGGPLIDARSNELVGVVSFIHPKKNCTDFPQGRNLVANHAHMIDSSIITHTFSKL